MSLDPLSAAAIAALVAAPFAGSFAGTLGVRLAEGAPVVWSRSACGSCGQHLRAADLVPLASWIASRGRCRHCKAAIGVFYPGVELAALGIALWAAAAFSGWLVWASCALGWTLLALAIADTRRYVLPDSLTLPLAAGGLLLAWDGPAFVDHVLGAVSGFAVFAAAAWAYRRIRGREGLGLGDAKLLAAAGAWVAWQGLASVVFIAAVLGLGVALARAAASGRTPAAKDRVPFGATLALGLWLVWLYGPLGLGW